MCLGDEVVDSRGEPTAATFHQPARFLTADCGVRNPRGYIYSITPNLRLRDHLRRGAGKNRSTRGPGQPPGDSVFSIWQGSCTHNDTTRWHANVDGGNIPRHHPQMQKYWPVVAAHKEELVFSRDEPPDDLSNPEQSALNIYSYKQHQMGSAVYIYIYTHVCIK